MLFFSKLRIQFGEDWSAHTFREYKQINLPIFFPISAYIKNSEKKTIKRFLNYCLATSNSQLQFVIYKLKPYLFLEDCEKCRIRNIVATYWNLNSVFYLQESGK